MRFANTWKALGSAIAGCMVLALLYVVWVPERSALNTVIKLEPTAVFVDRGDPGTLVIEQAAPVEESSTVSEGEEASRAAVESAPDGLTLLVRAMWAEEIPMANQEIRITLVRGARREAEGFGMSIYGASSTQAVHVLSTTSLAARTAKTGLLRVATTDSEGRVRFDGLPGGLLKICPVGLGFDVGSHERSFDFEEDMTYEYLVTPGLSFQGRMIGASANRLQLKLRDFTDGILGGQCQLMAMGKDGRFTFRVDKPGEYYAYLFDASRWRTVLRFPSFQIDQDIRGARFEIPLMGNLHLKAQGLPEGVDLLGSYLKRVEGPGREDFGDLWLTNNVSKGDHCSFLDLPYGDYQLFVRGVQKGDDFAVGGGRVLECVDVVVGQAEQTVVWDYTPLPTIWLRVSVEPRAPREPQEEAPPGNEGVVLVSGSSIEMKLDGTFKMTLPRGARLSLPEEEALRAAIRPWQNAMIGSDNVTGTLWVSSLDRKFVQSQGFSIRNDKEEGAVIRSSIIGNRPFSDIAPRVQDGLIELVVPRASGRMELIVIAPGFNQESLSFSLLHQTVLEVHLIRVEAEPVPEILIEITD